MKAAILTIGDEILIGQITDTNAAFTGSELNKAGISVVRIVSVPDRKEDIFLALDNLKHMADIILITGGLGPTNDDITKFALAEYFNQKLVLNNEALDHLNQFLLRRKAKINERNRNQAVLPENCELIPNMYGTAMGMWFEQNNVNFISMPGVPFEMKAMLTGYVIPELKRRFSLPVIMHCTVYTSGIAESVMADKLSAWESSLPAHMKLAYLPSPGVLRLRLTATGSDEGMLEGQVSDRLKELVNILGKDIFGFNETSIEAGIGKLLKEKNATVVVAESCTGGRISQMLTSVPGSSEYFKGGVIAYSNSIKADVLQVDKAILEKYGAVSEPVVIQMAENARLKLNADYGIATSGIAGPDGGTPDKPVGTVWIAVSSSSGIKIKQFHFGDNRERNIIRTSIAAINMLRLMIIG